MYKVGNSNSSIPSLLAKYPVLYYDASHFVVPLKIALRSCCLLAAIWSHVNCFLHICIGSQIVISVWITAVCKIFLATNWEGCLTGFGLCRQTRIWLNKALDQMTLNHIYVGLPTCSWKHFVHLSLSLQDEQTIDDAPYLLWDVISPSC